MAGNRTLKLSILADVDDLKKKLDTGSKEVEGFGGKLEKFGKVAAAAFAAAAAAAAAYAGKLAIEGVKAAIEDEAAQNRLANALRNVTKATDDQIASVEEQITKLSLANGIADDQLRPAFQRLATATGDLSTANKSLSLALDISAATGKDLNSVTNALGKAYEGNTSSLARLGIGLSTAEIKTLGLDGTMNQLAETFGGAATVQANTLEGQIARLKVGFDEAKESVGAALLPALQNLLNFFVNTVIPQFIKFKDAALQPVTNAIENNKEALTTLWRFIKDFVVPVIIGGLGDALKFIGTVAGGIINVIGAVVNGIKSALNFAIDGINKLIDVYNATIGRLPGTPDVNRITKPSFAAPSAPKISAPNIPSPSFSGGSLGGGGSISGGGTTVGGGGSSTTNRDKERENAGAKAVAEVIADLRPTLPISLAEIRARESGDVINYGVSNLGGLDVARVRAAEQRSVTVVVQAPSAIDEEGFKRAVVDALNESANRGTGGGGGLRDTAQVL
jgi:uncharacterized membrane protein YgcG